ncbi:MAG: hypothetical protein WCL00_10035, partial [Bacteroidota bacterium]
NGNITEISSEPEFTPKNAQNLYVGDYVDKNRPGLQKSHPDFKTFDLNFKVDDKMMDSFFALAEKEGVKKNEKEYAISEKLIRNQIKALIAQKLWDITQSYAIFNQIDEEVQKAVEVIENEGLYRKYQQPRK